MNPITILNLATALTQLAKDLVPVVAEVKRVLSSDDRAAISQALVDLQSANDALYNEVQEKLTRAIQE